MGKADCYRSAVSEHAVETYGCFVEESGVLDDRKPESRSADFFAAVLVYPVEPFKYTLLCGIGYAYSVVADGKRHTACGFFYRNVRMTAVLSVLYGVVEEIIYHFIKNASHAENLRIVPRDG